MRLTDVNNLEDEELDRVVEEIVFGETLGVRDRWHRGLPTTARPFHKDANLLHLAFAEGAPLCPTETQYFNISLSDPVWVYRCRPVQYVDVASGVDLMTAVWRAAVAEKLGSGVDVRSEA